MIWDEYGCEIQKDILREPNGPQFIGLECEIESILQHGMAEELGWCVTTDGSLRNNGYEYISKAVPVVDACLLFNKLHATIKTGCNDPFSQRTSIHVHANCANMTQVQVRSAIMLYALFEEAFFLMCSQDRRENIHCTPLTETYLPNLYASSLGIMVNRWHKYTALNIKPLSKYGTIEFRHMHGHNDPKLLEEWLTIIQNLLTMAKSTQFDLSSLEEGSIRTSFMKLFSLSRLGNHYELIRSKMTNQIIDLKLAVA